MTGEKEVPENRPRHPNKEIEAVICAIEAQGWRVMKARKYYKTYCPCDLEHMHIIHLTPSGRMYVVNLRKWYERQPCWR